MCVWVCVCVWNELCRIVVVVLFLSFLFCLHGKAPPPLDHQTVQRSPPVVGAAVLGCWVKIFRLKFRKLEQALLLSSRVGRS